VGGEGEGLKGGREGGREGGGGTLGTRKINRGDITRDTRQDTTRRRHSHRRVPIINSCTLTPTLADEAATFCVRQLS